MYKIDNYILDKEQESIVLDESKNLLVVAGAGSGKTLTILGKVKYLIEHGINTSEILLISFTNKATISLKEKIKSTLNIDIDAYTFHKLSLEILKNNNISCDIASTCLLEDIINSYFYENNFYHKKLLLKYFNYKKDYDSLIRIKNKEIELLKKEISTFIRLFKCNNYDIGDFKTFFRKTSYTFSYKKYKKEKIFLLITLNIYLMYTNYLKENNEIDFDDMIIKATELVKDKFTRKIKYIIIDEYQDTSFIRFNLIKEIINKTNSNLMVVGDDYQSIYRFTGCDIDLFLNFNKYFKDSKILKINSTYRNSLELITVSSNFISKNRKQIKKKLSSNKRLSKPIKIIYYKNKKEDFKKLILDIYNLTLKPILVLGRNNKDIISYLDSDFKLDGDKIIYKKEDIDITYLTVHRSKGLECDNVIVLNVIDDYLGFPSKIKEDSILRLVSLNKEKYPYSEERRLFYVALTRTKNYVYLMTKKKSESIFIKELERNYKKFID